jgi:hypothetical protein
MIEKIWNKKFKGIIGLLFLILSILIEKLTNKISTTLFTSNIYISPQINRAVKNKSYFYNCYGKEEKFYIENQG